MRKLINKFKKKHTKSNSFKYKLTKVMKPMKQMINSKATMSNNKMIIISFLRTKNQIQKYQNNYPLL